MIKVDSNREFNLLRDSFSVIKDINLSEIGFNNISGSNLYLYQSEEYKILNYSIKPKLIFLISNEEDDSIYIKLKSISINNLPFIFKTLKVTVEVNIFLEKDLCKLSRHISLKYEGKNKLITFLPEDLIDKILNNLIEVISNRFDKKLIKKVLKVI